MQPVRLAVVGTGRMGRLHVDALSAAEEIALVGVVDERPEVVRAAAEASGATPYRSVEELMDAGTAEAWLIATPTPTHPDLVRFAVTRGLHVLCEKPLSLDVDEHHELGSLATQAGVVLQVGFWRRFSPPWVAARELIAGGAIGDPLMLRLAQWDANPPPAEFCDPAISGGLAVDCGVHEYDLAEWLTGRRISSVRAWNLPVVDEAVAASGDVDNLVAMLDIEGVITATVDLSRNARYGDDVRTEILGSGGAIFVDLLPTAGARLATAEGVRVVAGSEAQDGTAAGVRGQMAAFAASIRGSGGSIPDAEASRRALAVGRAVQTAAASGGSMAVTGG